MCLFYQVGPKCTIRLAQVYASPGDDFLPCVSLTPGRQHVQNARNRKGRHDQIFVALRLRNQVPT